jgi:membrane protease YdiL (CAAX protease family)
VRANLLIGLAWGLWHAPLIAQGYNYPGSPWSGVLAMVAFCTGMSFVLTAVREMTGSVIPVAATHGMFNGIAPILLILAPQAHPVLAGPLGLVGAGLFALLGGAAWAQVRRGGRGRDARWRSVRLSRTSGATSSS